MAELGAGFSSEEYYLSPLSCSLRVGKEEVVSDELLSLTGDVDFPNNLQSQQSSPPESPYYCNLDSPDFRQELDYLDQQDMEIIKILAVPGESGQVQQLDLTNEGTYVREILIGSSNPRLPLIEGALGSFSEASNAQLLYDAVLYGIQAVDVLLMEAIRLLSQDPSRRRLQAGLELEAEMMDIKDNNSVCYQGAQQVNRRKRTGTHSLLKKRKGRRQPTVKKKKTKGKREKTSPASQKLLKEWLFSHSRCPYPTEEDKQQLCQKTGLSLQQLNNWFINARRRILPQKKTK